MLRASTSSLCLCTQPVDCAVRDVRSEYTIIQLMAVAHLAGIIGPTIGAALLEGLPIREVLLLSTVVALSRAAIYAFVCPGRRRLPAAVGAANGE